MEGVNTGPESGGGRCADTFKHLFIINLLSRETFFATFKSETLCNRKFETFWGRLLAGDACEELWVHLFFLSHKWSLFFFLVILRPFLLDRQKLVVISSRAHLTA